MPNFYFYVQDNELNGCGQARVESPSIVNVIVTEEMYNNYDKYMWNGEDIVLNPNYEAEQLAVAKQVKYTEANTGARLYLESGNALFEFAEGKHIEATDGNIAKLTAYALAYVTGQLEPTDKVVWNTKEDETVELTAEQVAQIITGLGQVQAAVWAVKFPAYAAAIETAETIEEVEAIVINYAL